MGRRTAITFVPAANKNGGANTPLDLIPADIKRECEEVYFALQTNDGRMHLEFDTADEVKEYRRHVESYCKNRPTDLTAIQQLFADYTPEQVTEAFGDKSVIQAITKAGPLRFRQSPVKGQADTMIDFRITDIPATDPNTDAIREATAAVTETLSEAIASPAKATGRRK